MQRELKLIDELDAFADGGEITHALALTYGYDGDWTEERLWRPLVERYGVAHPLVFTDGAVADAGTALRVHVVRMRRQKGLFHPKLLLAIREGAALLIVGSANLTRGGLGGNLELVTALRFGAEGRTPATVLRDALTFIEKITSAVPIDASTRDVVAEILRLARVAADDTPAAAKGPQPTFLTSLARPLWEQIVGVHGDDPLERLLVVSPFHEQEREVADPDGSLLAAILTGAAVRWMAKPAAPRVRLHTAGAHPMFLPVGILREAGGEVELLTQRLSVEPRRLHGEIFCLLGRKRTTVVWGSASFTPSALLRTPEQGGNVECVLAISVPRAELDEGRLVATFGLATVFGRHDGAHVEAVAPPAAARPLFEVHELVYDHSRKNLTLFASVFGPEAAALDITLGEGARFSASARPGPNVHEHAATELEEPDRDTGKPRLRELHATVTARGHDGAELASLRVRLNVRFDDAIELAHNLLLGADAASPDALLMPSVGGPEARWLGTERWIASWTALRREGAVRPGTHQATLDVFFTHVRKGLDRRAHQLDACRGNRFALARWGRELRRAVEAAAVAELDPARSAFFVHHVAEHLTAIALRLPRWTEDVTAARAAIGGRRLASALNAVPLPDRALPGPARQAEDARARAAALLEGP